MRLSGERESRRPRIDCLSPGYLLRTKSWAPDGPLDAWKGLKIGPVRFLFAKSSNPERYFRITNEDPINKISSLSEGARKNYDKHIVSILRDATHTGERALIRDASSAMCILAEHLNIVEDPKKDTRTDAIEVHAINRLKVDELRGGYALVARFIYLLAQEIGGEDATILVTSAGTTQPGLSPAASIVVRRMQDATHQAWDSSPEFAEAVVAGHGLTRDTAWALIPLCAPYDIALHKLPDDQQWIVD